LGCSFFSCRGVAQQRRFRFVPPLLGFTIVLRASLRLHSDPTREGAACRAFSCRGHDFDSWIAAIWRRIVINWHQMHGGRFGLAVSFFARWTIPFMASWVDSSSVLLRQKQIPDSNSIYKKRFGAGTHWHSLRYYDDDDDDDGYM
jgi:hypothetical protein